MKKVSLELQGSFGRKNYLTNHKRPKHSLGRVGHVINSTWAHLLLLVNNTRRNWKMEHYLLVQFKVTSMCVPHYQLSRQGKGVRKNLFYFLIVFLFSLSLKLWESRCYGFYYKPLICYPFFCFHTWTITLILLPLGILFGIFYLLRIHSCR